MDYTLLHIVFTEGIVLYVISYNPLHHISPVSSLGGDFLLWGGGIIPNGIIPESITVI